MIERFNRTLGVDLAKTVLAMETWPEYVAICVFRYNCSTHGATGQTPYKEMFGVESFEFDSGIDLRFRQDDEPANLPMRLAEVHKGSMICCLQLEQCRQNSMTRLSKRLSTSWR
jgi:hypothetical protein